MQSLIKAFGGIGVFLLGMIVMTEALRWLTRISHRNRLEIDQAVVCRLKSISGKFEAPDFGRFEMRQ